MEATEERVYDIATRAIHAACRIHDAIRGLDVADPIVLAAVDGARELCGRLELARDLESFEETSRCFENLAKRTEERVAARKVGEAVAADRANPSILIDAAYRDEEARLRGEGSFRG